MLEVNPRESQIETTVRCEKELQRLGVAETSKQARRAIVNAAFNGGYRPIEEGREIHWLAKAVVGGRSVVLLLLRREGSTCDDRPETVVVRGVYSLNEANQLLSEGRGLLPFIYKSGEDCAESNANN